MNRQRTIYFTFPMQSVISLSIKALISKAFRVNRFKAIWYLWKAYRRLIYLPEPTLENTWHPNTHNLIQARDWLLKNCGLSDNRKSIIRTLINFVIILYDFDSPWRWIIDSLREKMLEMEWKERGYEDKRHYDWWGNK